MKANVDDWLKSTDPGSVPVPAFGMPTSISTTYTTTSESKDTIVEWLGLSTGYIPKIGTGAGLCGVFVALALG